MSKFFDETRKAQERFLGQAETQSADIQQVLESVKASGAATEVAKYRLQSSRKARLARAANIPLISVNGDAPNPHTLAALECYRALRTRLLRQQSTGGLRSVVISSTLAGEGKTTTTMNLALSCSRLHDMRVLLVDADLRTRGLSKLHNAPEGPALSEILAGQAKFEDAVMATDLPNLFMVAAGAAPTSTPELFTGPRWKEFVGWCSESFNLILVDSPPILPLTDFELISNACDGILVVVRALGTRREALRKAADQINTKKLIGVVFNGMEARTSGYYYYMSPGYREAK
jgi:capsular exopolysaccharide synthesis family protein